ncbi:hypothetical protein C8Q79DRAFT_1010064 [Trametes meyenii]|nr:hypothetical protein C8Q79DRAFT_1010064 [Trametes meyenii]
MGSDFFWQPLEPSKKVGSRAQGAMLCCGDGVGFNSSALNIPAFDDHSRSTGVEYPVFDTDQGYSSTYGCTASQSVPTYKKTASQITGRGMDANNAKPLNFRNITSACKLDAFIDHATHNPILGTVVETLRIDLLNEAAFSAAMLRSALVLAPNVQDLLLYLPPPVPLGLLANARFPTLDFFATNVPHASLPVFLSNHPTLTSLILGPCGKTSPCLLESVKMPNIASLQCTMDCLPLLPYEQVSRLTLDHPDSGACAPTVLRAMTATVYVTSLTVDIYPNDFDILEAIAQATPLVRKLKLVEKNMHTRVDSPGRRPWNDRSKWHRELCKLSLLEELGVVTEAPLISGQSGDFDEELKVIMLWSEAKTKNGGTHATLYHIMLRYGAQTSTSGVLSHWYKVAGSWTHVTSASGPTLQD